MLRYFVNRRVQVYFDFVLNLVDVRDVAAGLLLAMERGQSGHRYILGGEAISLGKLLKAVEAVTGRKSLRVPIPAEIARTTAAIMELVSDRVTHRPPAGTVEGVRIALRSQPLSIEKSRRDLGYAPNPIGPALRETVASFVR
jgi:dihydroflavonol-4-reductase